MGGPGWLGGRTPRGPRGLGEGSRGRPFPGGGGGCSLPGGRRGPPLMRGGGGRAYIARCRAMSIHGRAAWDYIPNPPRRSPFLGGLRGGGGWRLSRAPTHAGGGSPVGAPSGLAENTRWRPLGPWAPSRKNLGFAGGDSAIYIYIYIYPLIYTPLPTTRWLHHAALRYVRRAQSGAYMWWKGLNSVKTGSKRAKKTCLSIPNGPGSLLDHFWKNAFLTHF